MISEIRLATAAVRSLSASLKFYQDTFDYVCHGEGVAAGAAFETLWQMPPGLTGSYVVLGPRGASTGLLRLVQFDQPGVAIWGDYSHPENYGHYALNIRVPELTSAIDRILANGGRAKSAPTHWTVSPELSAWDSLSYDPDGILLDVFQLEAAPGSLMADYDGQCSGLQTIAMHVSDARSAARFYAALGFRPWYDKLLENMESFFKLPEGTALHNINLVMPGNSSIGRIEIAQYVGFPGKSLRHVAVPPNIGILSISMESQDLAGTISLLHSIGAEPCGATVEVNAAMLGKVRARSYFGPNDEVLEFFQRA
ncbi:MAG TPA: hypothetical protein P5528_04990 [Steroidobacteraceae bacterium]|nr:hypothetical protein [Steroidobacteraceae bacterium]HRX88783.1 hypothetical protein [Steroidobacteraceae bacterium]